VPREAFRPGPAALTSLGIPHPAKTGWEVELGIVIGRPHAAGPE